MAGYTPPELEGARTPIPEGETGPDAGRIPSLAELNAQEPPAPIGYQPPPFDPTLTPERLNGAPPLAAQSGQGPVMTPSAITPSGQPAQQGRPQPTAQKQAGPKGPTDVAGYDRQFDQAAQKSNDSLRSAETAKLDAQGAQNDRTVQAGEEYIKHLAEADTQWQKRRELANRQADAETANWLQRQQTLANQEPNRGRYWQNQSTFGKAVWMASVGLMAVANSGNPQAKNVALEMLMHEVDGDVQSQKDRLSNQKEALLTERSIQKDKQGRMMHDAEDDYAKQFQRLGALRDTLLERAKRPGSAEYRAVEAGVTNLIDQKMQDIALMKRNDAVKANEAAQGRAHSAWLQKSSQDFQLKKDAADKEYDRWKTEGNWKKDYDLAQMSAETSAKNAAAKGKSDLHGVNIAGTGTYVSVPVQTQRIGHTGKIETVTELQKQPIQTGSKEEAQAISNLSWSNNVKFKSMQDVAEALKTNSAADLIRNNDPRLISALWALGYGNAKAMDPNAKLTDEDVKAGVQNAVGGDLQTWKGRTLTALGIGANGEKLQEFIKQEMESMPKRVGKQISSQIDPNIGQGGEVIWTPEDITAAPLKAPTSDSVEAQNGGVNPRERVTTDNYKDLKAKDQALGGGVLPELAPSLATEVRDTTTNMLGGDKQHVEVVATGAVKRIAAQLKDKKITQDQADDATARIKVEAADALQLSKRVDKALGDVLTLHTGQAGLRDPVEPVTMQELDTKLDKRAVSNIPATRKAEFLTRVNTTINAINKARKENRPVEQKALDSLADWGAGLLKDE